MTNTQSLLERGRLLCNPPTWYALATALDMHPQAIYKVMKRGGGIANGPAFRLAKLIGMDASTVIAYIEEDRAPATEKEFWRTQLPRLLATIGLAAIVAPHAPQAPRSVTPIEQSIHYAHRRLRRLVQLIRNGTEPGINLLALPFLALPTNQV